MIQFPMLIIPTHCCLHKTAKAVGGWNFRIIKPWRLNHISRVNCVLWFNIPIKWVIPMLAEQEANQISSLENMWTLSIATVSLSNVALPFSFSPSGGLMLAQCPSPAQILFKRFLLPTPLCLILFSNGSPRSVSKRRLCLLHLLWAELSTCEPDIFKVLP